MSTSALRSNSPVFIGNTSTVRIVGAPFKEGIRNKAVTILTKLDTLEVGQVEVVPVKDML